MRKARMNHARGGVFTDALCEDRRASYIAGRSENITCPKCIKAQERSLRVCKSCNLKREWSGDTLRVYACPKCGSQ